jgi:hypothetical protein
MFTGEAPSGFTLTPTEGRCFSCTYWSLKSCASSVDEWRDDAGKCFNPSVRARGDYGWTQADSGCDDWELDIDTPYCVTLHYLGYPDKFSITEDPPRQEPLDLDNDLLDGFRSPENETEFKIVTEIINEGYSLEDEGQLNQDQLNRLLRLEMAAMGSPFEYDTDNNIRRVDESE